MVQPAVVADLHRWAPAWPPGALEAGQTWSGTYASLPKVVGVTTGPVGSRAVRVLASGVPGGTQGRSGAGAQGDGSSHDKERAGACGRRGPVGPARSPANVSPREDDVLFGGRAAGLAVGDRHLHRAAPPAGSNSSIGLPSGSSSWTCLPPGPTSISLRSRTAWRFSSAIRAGRSLTSRITRFHPPGSCRPPSGIGREPDAPGPLRISLRSPMETCPKAGRYCWSRWKPRVSV